MFSSKLEDCYSSLSQSYINNLNAFVSKQLSFKRENAGLLYLSIDPVLLHLLASSVLSLAPKLAQFFAKQI